MVEMTPELQLAVDEANGEPAVVVDRRTQETYVVVRTEIYMRLTQKESVVATLPDVPAGIKLARIAFRRDLPSLLADRKMRGKYVCYHKDGCAAVACTYDEIIREFVRRSFAEDEYLVEKVVPGERPDEEEFDRTFVELDEEPTDHAHPA